MSEWKTLRIDQFAEVVTGATPKAADEDSWGDYIDFVTPSDQCGDREMTPARRLSVSGKRRLQNRVVPARSTALTCIGATIGKVSMNKNEAVTNQQINTLVAKQGIIDPDFLYYLIREWSPTLGALASGSATPIVNKSSLSAFRFSIPSLSMQVPVGKMLGALDDKIAANRSIVDAGIQLLDLRFNAARKGVGGAAVSTVAQVVLGGTPSRKVSDYWGGDVPWINSGACNKRIVISASEMITQVGLEKSAAKMLPVGATCVAITGATLGQMAWLASPMAANQSVVGVVAASGHRLWLHLAVRAEKNQLLGWATGGAQQHVNKNAVGALVVPFDSTKAKNFGESNASLMDRLMLAEEESKNLAITRDELLPLLISGKITVKDAEKTVEEVV